MLRRQLLHARAKRTAIQEIGFKKDNTVKYKISSETEPALKREGALWFNPLTEETKICHNGKFIPLSGNNAKAEQYKETKKIVFFLGGTVKEGIQDMYISFPDNGQLSEIKSCATTPSSLGDLEISIEKNIRDLVDKEDWIPVTCNPIKIKKNKLTNEGEYSLKNLDIERGDYFRLIVKKAPGDVANVTIEVDIDLVYSEEEEEK